MPSLNDLPIMATLEPVGMCSHLPVHQDPGGWAALEPFESLVLWGYQQVTDAMMDPRLAASPIEVHSFGVITEGPVADWARNISSFMDGPDHHKLRTPVLPHFSQGAVEQYRAAAADAAALTIASLPASGPVDLAQSVGHDYPLNVFAGLIGVDRADLQAIAPHVETMTRLWSYEAGEWHDRIAAALPQLDDLAARLIASPAGLVQSIAATELPAKQQRALVAQMLIAGWETTASQVTNLLYLLLSEPTRWDDLDRYPLEAVVDEALRYEPTAPMALRYASEDFTFHGLEIPAGTRVLPSFIWASRDPNKFSNPDTWNPGRYAMSNPEASPLVFSAGRHACLGRHLARLELVELARALTESNARAWTLQAEPDWHLTYRPRRPTELVVHI